jgi:hypothetical protein
MKSNWIAIVIAAYVSVLACVLLGEIYGVTESSDFIARYQSLIAGLATLLAVYMAVAHLRDDRRRHVANMARSYDDEVSALVLAKEMGDTARRNQGNRLVAALMKRHAYPLAWIDEKDVGYVDAHTQRPVSSNFEALHRAIKARNDFVATLPGLDVPLSSESLEILQQLDSIVDHYTAHLAEAVDTRMATIQANINSAA